MPYYYSDDPFLLRLGRQYPTWLYEQGRYYPLDEAGNKIEFISSDAAPLNTSVRENYKYLNLPGEQRP